MSGEATAGCWVLVIILVIFIMLAGWIHPNDMVIDGVKFSHYGFINKDSHYNSNIEYKFWWPAGIAGILLSEFAFIPTIYYYGFACFTPVDKWDKNWNAYNAKQLEGARFRH